MDTLRRELPVLKDARWSVATLMALSAILSGGAVGWIYNRQLDLAHESRDYANARLADAQRELTQRKAQPAPVARDQLPPCPANPPAAIHMGKGTTGKVTFKNGFAVGARLLDQEGRGDVSIQDTHVLMPDCR
jgi:hypothetical protein